jgi:hypothetical protein
MVGGASRPDHLNRSRESDYNGSMIVDDVEAASPSGLDVLITLS